MSVLRVSEYRPMGPPKHKCWHNANSEGSMERTKELRAHQENLREMMPLNNSALSAITSSSNMTTTCPEVTAWSRGDKLALLQLIAMFLIPVLRGLVYKLLERRPGQEQD